MAELEKIQDAWLMGYNGVPVPTAEFKVWAHAYREAYKRGYKHYLENNDY